MNQFGAGVPPLPYLLAGLVTIIGIYGFYLWALIRLLTKTGLSRRYVAGAVALDALLWLFGNVVWLQLRWMSLSLSLPLPLSAFVMFLVVSFENWPSDTKRLDPDSNQQ